MTADLSPTGGRDVHTVRFPVATPPSEVDVLVVGAGPNGLGAAVELTVSVAGGWRAEALTEDADGVTVEIANIDSGDRRGMRARYVIGADGGSSSVRALAGIEREGERATEKRLRLIIRTGDISDRVGPAPSGVNIVVNAKADGFLAAVSDREWRIYGGPYPLDYEPTEDELIEIGRAAFGFDLDPEVVSATTYYAASRIAATFRRGRVLLLGDAAHVRTPGGNLGEGFGDAANLGWKRLARHLTSRGRRRHGARPRPGHPAGRRGRGAGGRPGTGRDSGRMSRQIRLTTREAAHD